MKPHLSTAIAMLVALGIESPAASAMRSSDKPAATPIRGRVVIPMSTVDGRPTIEIEIGGRGPLRFVVDTGFVGEMAISPEVVERIGLKPTGALEVGDPSGRHSMKVDAFAIGDVHLGSLDLRNVTATALPPRRPSAGTIDGVIGLGLLRDLLVSIDFGAGRLTVEHGSLVAGGARTVRLSRAPSGLLRLPVTIGTHPFALDLDTGNGRSALFLPAEAIGTLPTRGAAREVGTARTISQELSISAIELAAPVRVGTTALAISSASYPPIAPPGNIGSPAFAGMRLDLDLSHLLARVTPSAAVLPRRASGR